MGISYKVIDEIFSVEGKKGIYNIECNQMGE